MAPVILVTLETEAGGSQVRGDSGKLRKTMSQKGIGMWLSDKGTLGLIASTPKKKL